MEPLRLDVGDVFKPVDRHSTMRSAISWSYDLLHESERHVFLELTIFAGGWDLEGARSVCKTDGETRCATT